MNSSHSRHTLLEYSQKPLDLRALAVGKQDLVCPGAYPTLPRECRGVCTLGCVCQSVPRGCFSLPSRLKSSTFFFSAALGAAFSEGSELRGQCWFQGLSEWMLNNVVLLGGSSCGHPEILEFLFEIHDTELLSFISLEKMFAWPQILSSGVGGLCLLSRYLTELLIHWQCNL